MKTGFLNCRKRISKFKNVQEVGKSPLKENETIKRERNNIEFYLEDSPSLKKYLCDEWIKKIYRNTCLDAMKETGLNFPNICPYSIEEILERQIER